ncbi:InlB B-repeat-containing protein [Halochromatium roseum]|uniref:InlB B-repeat-containing protein n=1 Tax=Halochromatium roseum TaxID=391920 RepID=UPI001912DA16|nr:DUF4214 domain-containing protein [Halochromatium roseum]MBK5941900.1 hypothetical protein [Halochromatium roseum]
MYLAYYGRPGDPVGVDYWAGRLAEVGGNWIADLVDAFGNSAEYTERYGALDDQTLINNLFLGLFNRGADASGLAYYVDLLNGTNASGLNPERRQSTLAQIALDIANGVQPGTDDEGVFANKLKVAAYFTDLIRTTGADYSSDDIPNVLILIASVGFQPDSVESAKQEIERDLIGAPGEDGGDDDITAGRAALIVPDKTNLETVENELYQIMRSGSESLDLIDAEDIRSGEADLTQYGTLSCFTYGPASAVAALDDLVVDRIIGAVEQGATFFSSREACGGRVLSRAGYVSAGTLGGWYPALRDSWFFTATAADEPLLRDIDLFDGDPQAYPVSHWTSGDQSFLGFRVDNSGTYTGLYGVSAWDTDPDAYLCQIFSTGWEVSAPRDGCYTWYRGQGRFVALTPRFWTFNQSAQTGGYIGIAGRQLLHNLTMDVSNSPDTEPQYYSISSSAHPSAGGSVSCNPNPVAGGESSSCTAEPNSGYSFDGWSGDCSSTEPICMLSGVATEADVVAHFILTNTDDPGDQPSQPTTYCGFGQWRDHPALTGEGYCDGYGDNITSALLEEANSATHCGGYYKTYGRYDVDGQLINVFISNGACEAAAKVFRIDPPEPLDEHCRKHGGTGNYRWIYTTDILPFGGYGTQGVTCEVALESSLQTPVGVSDGWRYPDADRAATRWDRTTYGAPSSDHLQMAWSLDLGEDRVHLRSGDVTGDGQLELVVVTDRTLQILDSTGQALVAPVTLTQRSELPILEDLDGDGAHEILIGVTGTADLEISVYNGSGAFEQDDSRPRRRLRQRDVSARVFG